jgi:hypothetical protein
MEKENVCARGIELSQIARISAGSRNSERILRLEQRACDIGVAGGVYARPVVVVDPAAPLVLLSPVE